MSLLVTYQGVSLEEKGILIEVICQLNKDLNLCGIDFEFDIESSKDNFVKDLLFWIQKTLQENENVVYNFLYRVDVNQELIYTNDGHPDENLLLLILNRELQKVVLKRRYSSNFGDLLS